MGVSISNSEWEILEKLWENGAMTIAQLEAAFKESKGWSRHAIISFLNKMIQKNLVTYEEIGRAKHFSAVPEKKQKVVSESVDFLNRVFNGKLGLMVSAMVEENQLSDEEVDELMQILNSKFEK